MQKYITIAALLAAGTSFSNAAVVTVSFSGTQTSDGTGVDWTVNGVDGYYVTSTLDSQELFSEFSWGALTGATMILGQNEKPLSAAGCVIGYNISATETYSFTFSFTAAQDVSISALALDGVLARNGGSITNAKDDNVSVGFTLSSGGAQVSSLTQTISGTTLTNVQEGNLPEGNHVSLAFSDSMTLLAGETATFTLAMARDSTTANVGFKSISLTATAIPEPSAFGLLAGAGALALVASRRRRAK